MGMEHGARGMEEMREVGEQGAGSRKQGR